MRNVFAIIVTYNPNFSLLLQCLQSIVIQVDHIVIINNGTTKLNNISDTKITIIELGKNMGIAYAQNRGIEFAISHNAEYVVFSDQDTIYPDNFIKKAFFCYEKNREKQIAAIVPLFFNDNKKEYAPIFISKTKTIIADLGKEYNVSHAISSGTFCPISIFTKIGKMNESLFIDWVDFEWCWRATNKGFVIICDTNNIIRHNMGDSYKKIFGHKIVVYSDFRNFYFFRNGIWILFHSNLLCFKEWVLMFKFLVIKSILFFATSGVSHTHLRIYKKAFVDGITGRLSILEENKE